MAHNLTPEAFDGLVGQAFTISASDVLLESVLTECQVSEHLQVDDGRVPFALIFRGPNDPVLNQGTYAVNHAELGEHSLFLVPVGPGKEGMQYQAVFS